MEKLRQWLDLTGTSARKLAEDLGVSHQTVYNWLDGSSYPYGPQLRRLHDHTHIALEYLVPPSEKGEVA